ncbi:mitochondrial transcription rescue factor 1 [Cotesia typhae]|uniref:mitochondrial transcription rescue factor 1 n=1 Tax=Cotesia typhae TaxID=2053667 RepID=UPI003D684751
MATVRLSSSYLSCLKLNKQLNKINSIYRIQLLSSHSNNDINNELNNIQPRFLRRELSNKFLLPHNLDCWVIKRWKSKKQKLSSQNQDDSDDEKGDVDDEIESIVAGNKNNKVITAHVSSMRIDAVVKAGMGIARNKAETALYESKLRINGQKVLKKGLQVGLEDEIDYIQGPSPKNPNFLIVTRLTVLDASDHPEGYKLKLLREKSLTIENYGDSWKPSEDSNS